MAADGHDPSNPRANRDGSPRPNRDGSPPPNRDGISAGGLVTAAFFVVLFVGPWKEFALRASSEGLPIDVVSVDGGGGGIFVAAGVAAIIAYGTCVNYLKRVENPPEGFRGRLIGSMLLVPILVALVLVILVVIWAVAQVDSEAPGGVVALMVGMMAWSAMSLFAVIFVGGPAAVGVWVAEKVTLGFG